MLAQEKSVKTGMDQPSWFAMSATFGRELKAKAILESKQVKCFVPMRYEVVKGRNQTKVRKLVPAINNLIFVYTTKERIQSLKTTIEYLQYLTKPMDGKNIPVTVPECQMQQFITVCDTHNEKIVYLSPDEIKLEKGTRVRIIGSVFDGIEGTFVKVNKCRKKRVVVMIEGITAAVLADFSDGYIQVIEDSHTNQSS